MGNQTENQSWHVTVDGMGRVLLPADLRRELPAHSGTTLQWVRDESGLHLKTYQQVIAEIQAYYKGLAPDSFVLTDALLEQRRLDASHD